MSPRVQAPRGWLGAGLSRTSDALENSATFLVATLSALLVLAMFVGVIYRYVLNDALPWTEEIAGFAMGWLVFVGAAVLHRSNGHPACGIVTSRLRGNTRAIADAVAEGGTGIYLLAMIWAGFGLLTHSQPSSSVLNLSYKLAYLSIPVSGIVMLVRWLRNMFCGERRRFATTTVVAALICGALVITYTGASSSVLTSIPSAIVWLILPLGFALGMPIAIVLGLSSTLILTVSGSVPLSIVGLRAYAGIDNPAFLAIPAFMLTGSLMLVTGMSRGLVTFACVIVGRLRGGLALADVVASVLFADISGSAVADTAAIGTTLMPEMVRRGYDRDFVAAHQAAAGSLGTLFPPSISMIIFATVTSVSVTGLFLSSIVPGLLVALTYMGIAYVVARRRNYAREGKAGVREVGRGLFRALPAVLAPVIVVGGILGGVFTPYEAGAVAAVYAAAVGAIVSWRSLRSYGHALVDAAKTSAMVLFIIANASVLAWVLTTQQVPQTVTSYLAGLTKEPTLMLMPIAIALIGLSIVLEPPAILIAVVPLMLPVVTSAGISPLQFGVVVMICGAIGMLLPPIGLTLLVSVSIIRSSLERAALAALPYVAAACCDLLLVITFPWLTSWLPRVVHS